MIRPRTIERTAAIAMALTLSLGSAAFTLWQNAHVAVLWDLSYLLDSSWRFALAAAGGPRPYRDLPFAHAPLTFVVQSWVLRLGGRVYSHHVVYAAAANAAATLLAWRILQRILEAKVARPQLVAALLALPLIPLGIYSVYPHPIYDSDAVLSVLFAIFCLQRIGPHTRCVWCLLTGAAPVTPLFYKQNIGLFFLASSVASLLAIAFVRQRQRRRWRSEFTVLLGVAGTLTASLLAIERLVGWRHYVSWTITFAAQRRLPGLSLIAGVYHQTSLLVTIPAAVLGLLLLWRVPNGTWSRCAALALLALPFVYVLAATPFADDAGDRADLLLSLWPHLLLLAAALALWNLRRSASVSSLLPIVLLATIHGTFLSQQLWGSTYALWPLLLLLVAAMLAGVPTLSQARVAVPLSIFVSLTLLVCGGAYALSHDRLSYIALSGAPARSTDPALRGLTTPGPWLPDFDELLTVTRREIPAGDAILLFPGQDPFYYASGRAPRLPVLLFDPATNPYSPRELAVEVARQHVAWLIVPRRLQLMAPPLGNYDDYLAALQLLFVPAQTLRNYTLYRRR